MYRHRHRLAAAGLGFALSALGLPVEVGPVDRSDRISLRSGVIDVRDPLAPIPARLRADAGIGADYVLVKYPAPPAAAERRALAAAARIYAYLPHFAYLVRAPQGSGGETLRELPGVSWTGPYHPVYKLSPAVSAAAEDAAAGATLAVMVHVYPDADLAAVSGRVRELGVERIAGRGAGTFFSRLRLLATASEIARLREDLARIPEVFWIDLEPRRVLLNDTTVWVGQSGLDGGQATPVFDRGIYGEGQIVGVIDTGIDAGMCYFRDPDGDLPPVNPCDGGTLVDMDQRKLIAVDFLWAAECAGGISDFEWDTHDHGTHVAGTAVGDDLASPLDHDPGDGMAPGARLVFQDGGYAVDDCADLPGLGCPVVDLKPLFRQAYDQGARLHSNSWGDQENSVQNLYTTGSQDADEFMWEHRDFLLFFAAGNSGIPGSISSPSTAKSVVSVGATRRGAEADVLAFFSSCGPTDDGRIKPELTAPGLSIVSADNDGDAGTANCNTRTISGTSMATPAAAGLAALVRQYFADGWYPSGAPVPADGFSPSAALVKASLVNSAADMAGAGPIPDPCQGWGRVLLDDVLYFAGDGRRLWVRDEAAGLGLGTGGEGRNDFEFEVASAAEPFEVTLAWTDFPSTPAADPHLNNDLDLVVAGPAGTFLGNVFAGGESVGGGSADRLNTVEQVLLQAPLPGVYTVAVRAWNVPDGPQPFALVVTGDAVESGVIFADGFESGDASAWE